MSVKIKYTVNPEQVIADVRGWLTLQLEDGRQVKARKSQVRVRDPEGGLANRRIGNRRYNCTRYERGNWTAAGNSSMDNGDRLAQDLRGLDLEQVYKQAAEILQVPLKDLTRRYSHLNPGMQRMNLGNRMRAASAE